MVGDRPLLGREGGPTKLGWTFAHETPCVVGFKVSKGRNQPNRGITNGDHKQIQAQDSFVLLAMPMILEWR